MGKVEQFVNFFFFFLEGKKKGRNLNERIEDR